MPSLEKKSIIVAGKTTIKGLLTEESWKLSTREELWLGARVNIAHTRLDRQHIQAHELPGPALVDLATFFIEAIKRDSLQSGKSLEIFPTVLTALATSEETLVYGTSELSGEEFKKQLINRLCSSK
ncbi:Fanconi anemia group I protein [Varanus komodoensis]|nr:Fanconi anemia group I protein [Varanus komodoensis]